MKRIVCLTALVLGVALWGRLPNSGADVARLHPAEAVQVEMQGQMLVLTTDTGLWGRGLTAAMALEDLKNTAPGEVFLETAQVALVQQGMLADQLLPLLRPNCRLVLYEGEPDLEAVGGFLGSHPSQATLGTWAAGERVLPRLITKEGRMELVQP